MLNRLTLLSADRPTDLAALFTRAEQKRTACGPATSTDWVTSADDPRLRGAL
jgi:hypothetical protein